MTFRELQQLIHSDLYRCYGKVNGRLFFRGVVLGVGIKYLFWMRVTSWLLTKKGSWWRLWRILPRLFLAHYRVKFGIDVPAETVVGPGLLIGHFGGIHVNARARIGRNCNLSQDVTIGVANRGSRQGVPTIGNDVYIGPGAKIFGGIKIGDGVAIGANCVVNKDVPDQAVVVGVPGRIVSFNGSGGYVNRTDYDVPGSGAAVSPEQG